MFIAFSSTLQLPTFQDQSGRANISTYSLPLIPNFNTSLSLTSTYRPPGTPSPLTLDPFALSKSIR